MAIRNLVRDVEFVDLIADRCSVRGLLEEIEIGDIGLNIARKRLLEVSHARCQVEPLRSMPSYLSEQGLVSESLRPADGEVAIIRPDTREVHNTWRGVVVILPQSETGPQVGSLLALVECSDHILKGVAGRGHEPSFLCE